MTDYKKAAKIPVRLVVVFYVLTKTASQIALALDTAPQRMVTGAIMIFLVFVLTGIKALSRLQLSILVPLSIVAVELAAVSLFTGGDALIYIFLIGCSLISLMYVNVLGLFAMASATSAAVAFLIFACDAQLLGHGSASEDELLHFIGMVFIYAMIVMLGKSSVGMLGRFQKTGQMFGKVLGSSSSFIVIVNNQARVEYISKSFAEILGIEKQEYAARLPLADLFPSIELKYFFGELLEREGTIEAAFEIKVGDEPRNFMLLSVPMGESGIARYFDCVEITSVVEAKRAAEAATRSKSEFLAMMSHEIRTPLNAIIGIAQIQLGDGSLPGKHAAALEKIFASGNSLLGIINDILDMSKIETGKLDLNVAEYDMPSLINDTVQLNVVRVGSRPIKLKLDISESLPARLYGDELRLKQILNNLLSNAIKYTEKGQVKFSVSHAAAGDYVNLTFVVEDTGQGMRPEDRERLFTEYQRFNAEANRGTEGTGLGLNITRRLVEMMGGSICVESEYGKGSAFTVTVRQGIAGYAPIGKDLVRRLSDFTFSGERLAVRLQIAREPMPYGSVLVVDDVDTNLFVAEGLLRPYKLSVETAGSGREAIEKVGRGKTYDVIFMDHMMPEMDGIEATHRLRELGYAGLIVALTANALAGSDEMFARKGFDGFVPKPIDARQLNAALNKFIRDRHPEEAKKYAPENAAVAAGCEASEKLLRVFCRDAWKAAGALRGALASGDMKLLATTAHAMKSALASIGESGASKTALALETAGRGGDGGYVSANAEAFARELEALAGRLSPRRAGEAGAVAAAGDAGFLAEQLRAVKAACEGYDIDAALAALAGLREKPLAAGTGAAIDKIHDLLYLDSDFEGAADLAGALLG